MARWLKHPSDWRSVLCIALWPLCVAALYTGRLPGWALGLVLGLLIYLSLALPVIEHNHMHLRLWRTHRLNRLTDTLLSALQGRPVFLFHPAHNANHHRYHHGPRDAARTYRFAGGDTNHLWGYLLHPLQAVGVLWPLFGAWLARLTARAPAVRRYYLRQIAWAVAFTALMIAIDPAAWLKFVLLPQLLGLHWLLGANYLQHAHADGRSRLQFARNFTGGVNRWFFNIGYHTAHHPAAAAALERAARGAPTHRVADRPAPDRALAAALRAGHAGRRADMARRAQPFADAGRTPFTARFRRAHCPFALTTFTSTAWACTCPARRSATTRWTTTWRR